MPRWRSPLRTATDPADQPVTGSPDRPSADAPVLPPDAAPVLLTIARSAIAARLGVDRARVDPSHTDHGDTGRRGVVGGGPEPAPYPSWLVAPGAAFVTLTIQGRLRGCIGSLAPYRSLRDDVAGNAVAAAMRDPRFPPLTAAELERTRISVSVLSAAVPLPAADEATTAARLRPGLDGLVLEHHGRRATLLPAVWRTVPDPADFLVHLKLKAGLPPGWWSDQVRISRYVVAEVEEPDPAGADR